jgi:hypothetical protein
MLLRILPLWRDTSPFVTLLQTLWVCLNLGALGSEGMLVR